MNSTDYRMHVKSSPYTIIIPDYRKTLRSQKTTFLLFLLVTKKHFFLPVSRKSGTDISSLFTLPGIKVG